MPQVEVLVIHVRGNTERKRYITRQLSALDYPITFIEDGNIEDITDDVLQKYFKDNGKSDTIYGRTPATSCAYKHLLAMEYIISHDLPGALVVEDDLRLKRHFKTVFEKSLLEWQTRFPTEPCIMNYEESSLMLVARSRRHRPRQVLYQAGRDRFAGCIYVSRQAAEAIMEYVKVHQSAFASDRLHSYLIQQGLLTYYWSYPCIACQCSCDGSMPTMIPTKPRPYKRLKWFFKKAYKHFLYWLR